ncbi:YpbF family protein [Peribacillus asahii]|uniref:YpbF family protein n=1 Tax=Peribacillus asahii TaxID=228899 RepID=UPI002079C01B|nr:YpbF family protein [Peribacillus asahii]USK58653.1 YpbF family protein [Peribacillus asahii]
MEPAIIMLDEHTDQATKQMLQHVVERKKKFEALQQKHQMILWGTISVTVVFILYLYVYVMAPYSYSFFAMFSAFVNQSNHVVFLLITMGLFGYLTMVKNKMEKAEKEYQLLRCEIINKSKMLWEKESEWKNRHKVFEMMKKNYDINLYHENK